MHSFTVENEGGNWSYNLVSTVFLHLHFTQSVCSTGHPEESRIAGTSTKNVKREHGDISTPLDHLARMGRIMEDNESDLRSQMDDIYVKKTKEIIYTGRLTEHTKNTKTLL